MSLSFDGDDMMPTRRELDAEAFKDSLDKECQKDSWYARAGELLARLGQPEYHRRYWQMVEYRLENMMDDFRRDAAAELRESMTDEYELRGLRRSDF